MNLLTETLGKIQPVDADILAQGPEIDFWVIYSVVANTDFAAVDLLETINAA